MDPLLEISHKNAERIAVLESSFARHEEVQDAEKKAMAETIVKLFEKLDEISTQLTKQKGMLGGIALVFSGIAAVAYILKDYVFNHLR